MRYAYDFSMAEGTPVLASMAGTVTDAIGSFSGCGGAEFANSANRVTIQHDDGTSTLYLHLQSVSVSVGDPVLRGETIGLSGKTGWTASATGQACYPHLHFQRQAQGAWITNSAPVYFDEYPGQQLQEDQAYTSANTLQAPPTPPVPPAVQPLGGLDLYQYCRSLPWGFVGYDTAIDPDYGRVTAYSLRCKAADGKLYGIDMYGACQWQYPGTPAVDVMRDFNSTTLWRCYPITSDLGKVQPSDVTAWCKYTGRGTSYELLEDNAYGIWCKNNSGLYQGVDMQWLCQWKHNRTNVIDVMRDYNNVWDWKCYGVTN